MNSILRRVGEVVPQITDICYYSRDQVNKKTLSSIDEVFRDSEGVTKSLEYCGIRAMTPLETYESMASTTNTIEVDITKSTFYKAVIEFKSKPDNTTIKIKMSLPYMDRYGILTCNDNNYNIKPIFTDNVLSPYSSGIFMKLYIVKSNISSVPITLIVNGEKENMSVIYSDINRSIKGDRASVLNKAVTPLAFYSLCEMGLRGVMKMITPAEFKVVELSKYKHNPDDGILYTYDGSPIGFLVMNHNRLDIIDNMIASLFYILTNMPSKTTYELFALISSNNLATEKDFWRFLFGRFFYKGSLTIVKSTTEIENHLEKVKNFLDSVSRLNLQSSNIFVKDFTELTVAILGIFNNMILRHKEISSDIIQNKKLNVIYYILNPVIIGANGGILEIAKREKNRNFPLSAKEKEKILSDSLTDRLIFKIVKSTKRNLSISTLNCCTDNLLDTLLVSDDQNRGDGVFVNSNNSFPSILRHITPMHYLVGDMHNLGKKAPTPLLRLNPFAKVDSNSQFVIDPTLVSMAHDMYRRMRAITEYDEYDIEDGELISDDE